MDRDRGFSSFQPLIIPTIQVGPIRLTWKPRLKVLCLRLEVVVFLGSSGPCTTHAHCHSRERTRVGPSDRAELSSQVTTCNPFRKRTPFPRADSHLLNNPIRPSTCTRVNIELVAFEGYSYTIVLKNDVELITVMSIFKSKHLSQMMNLQFYLIKIRRANSAAD
ncbi:hypothetical protein G5I_04016 [Acromyrmex echinatior]|uniref:Uncharacterized protein n=1 Tax=Acromyrmex echinatior TaxID=103372 RepID=F4WEL0_ACREC|nr:hypothetical protein G5I_04016 [Acromyrmex echinatior]